MKVIFLILFTVSSCLSAYTKNPYVSEDVWNKVSPYFLPEDHPARPILDDIFSSSRALLNIKTMKKAGFIKAKPRDSTSLIVTKHPALPGYVLKVYLDAQWYFHDQPEYYWWIARIKGVRLVRKEIEKNMFGSLLKVPNKWIYPLPAEPSPPKEFQRKNFILIEEDMDIYSDADNKKLWGSDRVSKELIYAVFTVLQNTGLHDCAKPDNIPFSHDGLVAFIDTQSYDQWPIKYKRMNEYLSKEMSKYWSELFKSVKKNAEAKETQ